MAWNTACLTTAARRQQLLDDVELAYEADVDLLHGAVGGSYVVCIRDLAVTSLLRARPLFLVNSSCSSTDLLGYSGCGA